MDRKHTKYQTQRGVATITLSRPEKLNAFTTLMLEEMIATIEEIDRDDAIRAVVVTGEGRAFCAGADLTLGGSTFDSSKGDSAVGLETHRDGGGRLTLAIHACRKPFIAAINGPAVGVGMTMTLPMDLRIAAEDAKCGFVFARRGIVPEACSSWFLPRIVGISKAAELCYTGRVFRAADESASGLFSYVLPSTEVLPKAYEIAREIADNTSATSVALSKALLWHGLGEKDPQSAHIIDSKCIHWCGQNPDAYEGVQSFLEKREAKFSMSPWSEMPDFYPWWKEPKV